MQTYALQQRQQGRTIGFVPTMGFLHEGHLSLMRTARQKCDCLVASIFVNPAQFGPNEDFDQYPRSLEQDLDLTATIPVDAVFTPTTEALYPDGYQTYVELENLPKHLCGISRPSFFKGVATVVTKLFNIVQPHVAVFGEKDFQQLAIIRRMTRDLNIPIEIIGGPTIREPDGLAMSSRNAYLTEAQRPAACALYQSLQQTQQRVATGMVESRALLEKATAHIDSFADTRIDYIEICDPLSLAPVATVDPTAVMAMAVFVGPTRLIDNLVLRV